MRCQNCNQLRETSRYKLALRQTWSDLCGECHRSLTNLGMTWVPDQRETDLTPLHERRQPEWLSRLTAKEMTA